MARKLVIDATGGISGLYSDTLVGLGEIKSISRASHVEWKSHGIKTGWYVQLSDDPRNGQHRGCIIGEGFATRAEALDFEAQWLEDYKLR